MRRESWRDLSTAAGLCALLSAIYWHGRSRSFGAGDSPQHVLSALTWGVSWPPGYPLYNFAAHFFSRLPLGAPEGSVNGFSGLCHAAAAGFFFLALRRQGLRAAWSAFAAALMGLSPLYWYYSEVAEVRALNDLLCAAGIWLTFLYVERRGRGALLALAAVLGLGVSHHPTFVLALPALAYWAVQGRAKPKPREAAAFVLTGLVFCALPYVILGIHLHSSPPIYNPMGVTAWRDVLDLFLRKNLGGPMRMVGGRGVLDFGAFQWAPLRAQSGWLLAALVSEPGPLGALAALGGAVVLLKTRRPAAAFWGLWLGLNLSAVLFFSSQQLHPHDPEYARAIAMRFYLMPFLGLFACAGFGLQWLADRWRAAAAVAAVVTLGAALRPIDMRGHDPLLRYGEDVLASSGPSDIIVLASDDGVLVMNYLDYVGRRTERRVFLNPVLFTFPPYIRDLHARYPDLNFPAAGPGGLPLDWKEWKRLNPSRRLLSEAMFLQVMSQVMSKDFPGVSPRGVLVEVCDKAAKPAAVTEEARTFLEKSSLSRITLAGIYPWTQEIYLARSAALLLAWYGSLVDRPGNEALVSDIRARLEKLP